MIEQLQIGSDGVLRSKVEMAIKRLLAFEPPEGYYLCFSGGKDSQCIYHLAKMAGVKFDAHYAATSCDPPELVQFLKKNYPDVIMEAQHYDDNKPEHCYPDGRPKPITMWSLIADHTLPPTRKVRYCCAKLKEPGGQGRIVVTGVRWDESSNRRNNHDVVDMRGKKSIKAADRNGADYRLNKHGELIMNDDNDAARRTVEQCYRTRKTMVNPIVDWTDEDVWNFLNGNGIPHCSLYDEGFTRLGCIGCPLSGSKNMIRDFERWPKYKELYIRAFQKMIDNHPGQIRILDPNSGTKFKLYDGIPDNTCGGYPESTSQPPQKPSDGMSEPQNVCDGINNSQNVSGGGGTLDGMVDRLLLNSCSDGSSTTATAEILGGGTPVHRLAGASDGIRCSSLTIGWKWAQHEDAGWMVDGWQAYSSEGKRLWGIPRDEIKEKTDENSP